MSASVTPTPSSILPEELKQIQDVQTKYTSLTRRYGELYFQNKFIAIEMQELDNEMINLENKRIEIMTTLQNKYGAGSIDVTNVAFTPVPVVK
jgi:hypothetical protein